MEIARTRLGEIEYRRAGEGAKVVLILHGGHMHAGIRLGEDYFLENGYAVIAVSRPGYGRTPMTTGPGPDAFADALDEMMAGLEYLASSWSASRLAVVSPCGMPLATPGV